jgi:hypothetical protein
MNNGNLRTIEISALSVSVIVTALAMLRAAMWKIDSGALLFILFAISPYICLFLFDVVLRRDVLLKKIPSVSEKMPRVFCVTSLLMLGFTLLTYVGTIGDRSSTYALIFLFVPFYLFAGGAVIVGGGLIWALFSKSSEDKNI